VEYQLASTRQFNALSRSIWEKYSTIPDGKTHLNQLFMLILAPDCKSACRWFNSIPGHIKFFIFQILAIQAVRQKSGSCAVFVPLTFHVAGIVFSVTKPASSCNAKSGVPLGTCQLARVCRRSCHRKSSIPVRFGALYQALVLSCLIGLLSQVNTLVGCFAFCARTGPTAVSLSGTAIPFLAFARSGWIHAGKA